MERKIRKRKSLNLNVLKENDPTKNKKLEKKKRKIENKRQKEQKLKESVTSNTESEVTPLEDEIIVDDPNDGEDLQKDDPFVIHLKNELSPELLSALSDQPPKLEKETTSWPKLGTLLYVRPQPHEPAKKTAEKKLILEDSTYTTIRPLPDFSSNNFDLQNLFIKSQIFNNVTKIIERQRNSKLTEFQKELLTLTCNYHDVYYPEENFENLEEIRLVYCIHVVNHVLKSRLKVMHHNAKLSKHSDISEDFRDQGLVRPKVLILLPFRDAALKVVKTIINILVGEGGHVMNKKRFMEEFTGDTIKMPDKNPRPIDYQLLFSGNTDDNFKIGLTVTKKCLKLYSDFYASDIIIASPLGLRILVGAEGEKERDYDFLAAIELLVMDQSQMFFMQNWEHLLHILSHLHLQPQESHGTDLARVRMWALNGWSKYYMQSLVFATNPLPVITALYNVRFNNYGGKVTVANPIKSGSISQVALNIPQVFHHVKSATVTESVDDRFEVLMSDIMPQFKDQTMKHILIYVPSYFDFVRLRNHFKRQEMKFVHICEYTEEKKIIRARSKLFHGETQFLLYTERFHFYRRIKLRGIQHIIFYQPPTFPSFYSEICNFLQDVKKDNAESGEVEMTVNVLYTKFDITQVAAIVGSERATRMLASDKPVHMFMTDN